MNLRGCQMRKTEHQRQLVVEAKAEAEQQRQLAVVTMGVYSGQSEQLNRAK